MARLTFLLLLLWAGVTVSTVVDLQRRIYNGRDCEPTERLYHVSLSKNPAGTPPHCGGSLIKSHWVLTAKHCLKNPMYVVVGVHPGPGTVVEIKDKVLHPDYDMMLLKLPTPVTGITAVPLSNCSNEPKKGDEVRMAGHGRYIKDANGGMKWDPPRDLKCADMHVSDCDYVAIKGCSPAEPDEYWICYNEPNVNPCRGDSGGGLIFKDKIHGVHIADNQCACTKAYALSVCELKPWIDANAK